MIFVALLFCGTCASGICITQDWGVVRAVLPEPSTVSPLRVSRLGSCQRARILIVVLYVLVSPKHWKFLPGGRCTPRPTTNLRSILRFVLYDDSSAGRTVNTTLLPDGRQWCQWLVGTGERRCAKKWRRFSIAPIGNRTLLISASAYVD
jgi:transposase